MGTNRKLSFRINSELQLILFFALIKVGIHFLTFSNYGLHRDAFLYYAQSEHLAFGYLSVPPATAFVAKLATIIFGNSIFGLRFFPAVAGGLTVFIIGLAVKELGGKKIAISLASLAFILSPSFLHTNLLLQPICFEHLSWTLAAYLIIRMINRQDPKMWIWIGLAFGLGFLNKYSTAFLIVSFGLALLLSPNRTLCRSRYFLHGLIAGLVLILPNIIWQYQNGWPVLHHMSELKETQLVHVHLSAFVKDQFLMNLQALILWFGALIILLFFKAEKRHRFFAYMYLIFILILIIGRGKSYYSLGIYPILFAFGGYFLEKYLRKFQIYVTVALVISMMISLYISFSFDGIPFISYEKAAKENAYRWEDDSYHDISQDMADMTGWDKLGTTVGEIYSGLNEARKASCDIYCTNYGQAGSVMFYGKKYGIPQPLCFTDNFVFWSPDSLSKEFMIWVYSPVDVDYNPDSLLPELFDKVSLRKEVNNKYFREDGSRIYFCENPKDRLKSYYRETRKEILNNYRK